MMTLATLIDRPLMQFSRGRLRLSFVIPVLLLRVRGRRSGELREVPLLYVPDDQTVLLLASNAGRGRLPAWYLNLRETSHVEVLLGGLRTTMSVMELSGALRKNAWHKAVDLYPGYVAYQQRTPYPIPVLRLSATAQDAKKLCKNGKGTLTHQITRRRDSAPYETPLNVSQKTFPH